MIYNSQITVIDKEGGTSTYKKKFSRKQIMELQMKNKRTSK